MTSYLNSIDADDLDKAVQQLMSEHEAHTAAVSDYEGLPLVKLTSDEGDAWVLLAGETPEHAPGVWHPVYSLMGCKVEPRDLCDCESGETHGGIYYPPVLGQFCPVHGVVSEET